MKVNIGGCNHPDPTVIDLDTEAVVIKFQGKTIAYMEIGDITNGVLCLDGRWLKGTEFTQPNRDPGVDLEDRKDEETDGEWTTIYVPDPTIV